MITRQADGLPGCSPLHALHLILGEDLGSLPASRRIMALLVCVHTVTLPAARRPPPAVGSVPRRAAILSQRIQKHWRDSPRVRGQARHTAERGDWVVMHGRFRNTKSIPALLCFWEETFEIVIYQKRMSTVTQCYNAETNSDYATIFQVNLF